MSGVEARAELYLRAVQREAARVLGMLDRESFSPTFGCLDRTYWAWKFTDFPGARFQEGLCTLSFLYATPDAGGPYHGSERLLTWIAAGFDFWSRLQRRGGDFDEAYPFERSLAATAFTSFYLSEAWRFLDGKLPAATDARFRAALRRAADWLVRNDERHGFLSNHLAAAAAALDHAHRITGEARFERRCRAFLERILEHQSSEGWYDEYGGADPGYQTHGSFYLARYAELHDDAEMRESLERSFDFLAHFIHPDGSLGGEYASRNTQTYYPAAFEMMAGASGRAAWIAETMGPSVAGGAAAGLASVDVYNLFPLLNNYTFAYCAARRGAPPAPSVGPSPEPGLLHFPKAGIAKVRRRRYDLFVGLHKGGVVKLFDRERPRLVASDCGYIGRLDDGRQVSSQWTDPERTTEVGEREIAVEGGFFEVSRPVFTPVRFLVFRLFGLTLGRVPRIAYWLKALLVRVLITRRRGTGLRFKRRIVLDEGGVEIHDQLQGVGRRLRTLVQADVFTTIHMGSSRYFVPHELEPGDALPEAERRVDPEQLEAGVSRRRMLRLD